MDGMFASRTGQQPASTAFNTPRSSPMSQRQLHRPMTGGHAVPIESTASPRAHQGERALPLHLKRLEAESIEIMREVVSEFKKPVMLYSIGKDSSVMLRLAIKAFYPAKLPFPLLHVDTTWKFREMIAFRDQTVSELGLDLIVHVNKDGVARGINPIA